MVTRFLQTIPALVIAVILTGLGFALVEYLLTHSRVADPLKRSHHEAYSDSVMIPDSKITPMEVSNPDARKTLPLLGMPNKPCTCLAFTLDGETSLVENSICCETDEDLQALNKAIPHLRNRY